MKLFNKEIGNTELHKSTMTAINLVEQAFEVGIGTRVRFDEVHVAAGKLEKDSSQMQRIMKLSGTLANREYLSIGDFKSSVSMCKSKDHEIWIPTHEGADIEVGGRSWKAYWNGYNPRNFTSAVSVFESWCPKSDNKPIWQVGHTALDRVQFKLSKLPQLTHIAEYHVDGYKRFVIDNTVRAYWSLSPRFVSHFGDKVEENVQGQWLQEHLLNKGFDKPCRDIELPLQIGSSLCEITLGQFFAFLIQEPVTGAFIALIRDTIGVLQVVYARRFPGQTGLDIDAERFGEIHLAPGFRVVSKKAKPQL